MSIVIPCFNQARFLGDAIGSALAQSYPCVEIVVVDDGSDDDRVREVAMDSGCRYVRQNNLGLSNARNRGFAESRGEYVVFLDADDRLLPSAVAIGAEELRRRPDCAFVSGDHRYINGDGAVLREWQRPPIERDHYAELLAGNFIGNAAAVMFRRSPLVAAHGFDPSVPECEDYDVYLRIARRSPVYAHNRLVSEYRKYPGTMSDDPARMLRGAIRVLRKQRPHVSGNVRLREAYQRGLRFWRTYYGPDACAASYAHRRTAGQRLRGWRELAVLAMYAPDVLFAARRSPSGTPEAPAEGEHAR
ncbi:MAG: glycosyltransferase [Vicinamibacterales bacterium]